MQLRGEMAFLTQTIARLDANEATRCQLVLDWIWRVPTTIAPRPTMQKEYRADRLSWIQVLRLNHVEPQFNSVAGDVRDAARRFKRTWQRRGNTRRIGHGSQDKLGEMHHKLG